MKKTLFKVPGVTNIQSGLRTRNLRKPSGLLLNTAAEFVVRIEEIF